MNGFEKEGGSWGQIGVVVRREESDGNIERNVPFVEHALDLFADQATCGKGFMMFRFDALYNVSEQLSRQSRASIRCLRANKRP